MVRYFLNKKNSETIRWEPANYRSKGILLKGRAGINHWHRLNPDTESDKQYLNAADTPCTLLSKGSFLPPADQVKDKSSQIAIEQNEEELYSNTQELIYFLDNKTDNWLHDSIIKSISIKDNLDFKVVHSNDGKLTKSSLIFYDVDISFESNLEELINKEIYFLKISSLKNQNSKLIIQFMDNSTMTIVFSEFKFY